MATNSYGLPEPPDPGRTAGKRGSKESDDTLVPESELAVEYTFRSITRHCRDTLDDDTWEACEDTLQRWVSTQSSETQYTRYLSEFLGILLRPKVKAYAQIGFCYEFALDTVCVEGGCGINNTRVDRMVKEMYTEVAGRPSDRHSIRAPDYACAASAGPFQPAAPSDSRSSSRSSSSSSSCATASTTVSRSNKRKRDASSAVKVSDFCACTLLIECGGRDKSEFKVLCQLCCYLSQGYEMCACQLGVMVHQCGFSRLLQLDRDHIVLETNHDDLGGDVVSFLDIKQVMKEKGSYCVHRVGTCERESDEQWSIEIDRSSVTTLHRYLFAAAGRLLDAPLSGVSKAELTLPTTSEPDLASTARLDVCDMEMEIAIAGARPKVKEVLFEHYPQLRAKWDSTLPKAVDNSSKTSYHSKDDPNPDTDPGEPGNQDRSKRNQSGRGGGSGGPAAGQLGRSRSDGPSGPGDCASNQDAPDPVQQGEHQGLKGVSEMKDEEEHDDLSPADSVSLRERSDSVSAQSDIDNDVDDSNRIESLDYPVRVLNSLGIRLVMVSPEVMNALVFAIDSSVSSLDQGNTQKVAPTLDCLDPQQAAKGSHRPITMGGLASSRVTSQATSISPSKQVDAEFTEPHHRGRQRAAQ